jgi:putative DNA primase/helicase
LATTSGSKSSATTTDWQPLAGRDVRIWRDNDTAGIDYQEAVKAALNAIRCNVSYVDVDALGLPIKGDVVDWLAMREGQTTTADDVLSLPLVAKTETAETLATKLATEETVATNVDTDSVDTSETLEGEPVQIDDEAEIQRLATLSIIDYERVRVDEAKRLGLRPAILDKLVKQARDSEEQEASGSSLFSDVEVWDDPVNIADVLDEIAMIIERHIVCEKQTITAAALWVVFSWCIDVMQVSPIACITAPEKRCGKTQLLNLIGMLCKKPLPASNITAAALFRSIEAFEPTLLIDEADAFLGQSEELRGIINSGHTRQSAFVIRTTGDNFEPTRFSTWGAKAISGIGHLSDTLKDRSILLELRRKQPNEHRQRLRHADMSQFERVKRKLARWSEDYSEALRIARPALPEALNDRAQDNWESLLSIADLAGESWAKTARHAAMAISGIEEDSQSINEELLTDIKQAFEKMRTTRISSVDLLEQLCSDDEAPWLTWGKGRPMTPRQLSKRLSEFGIASKNVRTTHGVLKSYELADFKDAFNRYLKATPQTMSNSSATPIQPNDSKACSQNTSATNSSHVADEKQLEPLQTKGCSGVADKTPLTGNYAANDNYQSRELGEI